MYSQIPGCMEIQPNQESVGCKKCNYGTDVVEGM